MLAVLYIALSWLAGCIILKIALPQLFDISKAKSLFGKPIRLDNWMVTVPASYLVGTLIATWVTYLSAYAFRWTSSPMFYGNAASFLILFTLAFYESRSKKKAYHRFFAGLKKIYGRQCMTFLKRHTLETVFLLAAIAVSTFLMFYTLNVKSGMINVGHLVFSDFGPHLALIRSFSLGSNFPTEYPHFPDGAIRYHFMFQFLAGNLEFLGLPLDWAFNLPSILAFTSFLMLLYSLAVILMGEPAVGMITVVLLLFRSSFAFFTFLASLDPAKNVISTILANNKVPGNTPHEDWGLWTPNVFVNQRHFAFSLGILAVVLILVLPLFKKMAEALRRSKTRRAWLNEFLLKRDAWTPESVSRPLVVGVLIGLLGFWNGAVVITVWLLLLSLAIFSKHRLEHLTIVAVSLAISILENVFFIGSASAVHPRLVIGFLATRPDIYGIVSYYIELLGILPFVIVAALLFFAPKGSRWLAVTFGIPLLFATTVQLTPDIAMNHKYVMVSVMLLNIIIASFLYRMFIFKKIIGKAVSVILIILLTITGIVDAIALYNVNTPYLTVKMNDPVMTWTEKNTGQNVVFLTDQYSFHPILLSGRKIFYGWPYFTWSAGYDTQSRFAIVSEIYGSNDVEKVRSLVNRNNISYLVIDDGNRNSKDYKLNEELIKNNFKLAYENEQYRMTIYKVMLNK